MFKLVPRWVVGSSSEEVYPARVTPFNFNKWAGRLAVESVANSLSVSFWWSWKVCRIAKSLTVSAVLSCTFCPIIKTVYQMLIVFELICRASTCAIRTKHYQREKNQQTEFRSWLYHYLEVWRSLRVLRHIVKKLVTLHNVPPYFCRFEPTYTRAQPN